MESTHKTQFEKEWTANEQALLSSLLVLPTEEEE
jgi:hypothetical protein